MVLHVAFLGAQRKTLPGLARKEFSEKYARREHCVLHVGARSHQKKGFRPSGESSTASMTLKMAVLAPILSENPKKARSGGIGSPDQAFGVNRVFVQCDATRPRGG